MLETFMFPWFLKYRSMPQAEYKLHHHLSDPFSTDHGQCQEDYFDSVFIGKMRSTKSGETHTTLQHARVPEERIYKL